MEKRLNDEILLKTSYYESYNFLNSYSLLNYSHDSVNSQRSMTRSIYIQMSLFLNNHVILMAGRVSNSVIDRIKLFK